jgi:hypothetical protein
MSSPTSPVPSKHLPSLRNAVKKVIETNTSLNGVSSPPSSNASVTVPSNGLFGNGSSKKERRNTLGSGEKAKMYYRLRLKALDAAIEVKVSDFTAAGKFGEHKDWQHTLIMKTPKKELPVGVSPVKFFSRASSATKQLFAPFFHRSASMMSVASAGEQSNAVSQSGGDYNSQIAEPRGDQSMVSAGGHSMRFDTH